MFPFGNFSSGTVAWEFSLTTFVFFRLGAVSWDLLFDNIRMGTFVRRVLGIFCLGRFAWNLSYEHIRLGSFVLKASFGNFRLGTFALGFSLVSVRLGSSVWELSFVIFRLVFFAWIFRLELSFEVFRFETRVWELWLWMFPQTELAM